MTCYIYDPAVQPGLCICMGAGKVCTLTEFDVTATILCGHRQARSLCIGNRINPREDSCVPYFDLDVSLDKTISRNKLLIFHENNVENV